MRSMFELRVEAYRDTIGKLHTSTAERIRDEYSAELILRVGSAWAAACELMVRKLVAEITAECPARVNEEEEMMGRFVVIIERLEKNTTAIFLQHASMTVALEINDAWAETSNVCLTQLERLREEAKEMEAAPCVD